MRQRSARLLIAAATAAAQLAPAAVAAMPAARMDVVQAGPVHFFHLSIYDYTDHTIPDYSRPAMDGVVDVYIASTYAVANPEFITVDAVDKRDQVVATKQILAGAPYLAPGEHSMALVTFFLDTYPTAYAIRVDEVDSRVAPGHHVDHLPIVVTGSTRDQYDNLIVTGTVTNPNERPIDYTFLEVGVANGDGIPIAGSEPSFTHMDAGATATWQAVIDGAPNATQWVLRASSSTEPDYPLTVSAPSRVHHGWHFAIHGTAPIGVAVQRYVRGVGWEGIGGAESDSSQAWRAQLTAPKRKGTLQLRVVSDTSAVRRFTLKVY